MTKIWDWIEKNRWTVITPLCGALLWVLVGFSCVPTTESPIKPGVQVSASELGLDYRVWQSTVELTAKKFDYARADIEQQIEQLNKLQEALMALASGSVTTWPGLLQLLLSGGVVGLLADNIRKNGVISGLKRKGK